MSRNINALVDVLKSRAEQVISSDLPDSEKAVVLELATVAIELTRQLLLDINHCADALEVLALDRKTARSGEKWP